MCLTFGMFTFFLFLGPPLETSSPGPEPSTPVGSTPGETQPPTPPGTSSTPSGN